MCNKTIDEIRQLFSQNGNIKLGENCTQLQHASQCAALAQQAGNTVELIVAAFLHDIGHLYAIKEEVIGIDSEGHREHDRIGAELLDGWGFPSSVTMPIALHVQAKRYLTSMDNHYEARLSRASQKTLLQQGKSMSNQEQCIFLQTPFAKDALLLREWDDSGKTPDLEIAPLDHWLRLCAKVLGQQVTSCSTPNLTN
ncbi:HD domain-containing protein [Microbulbifer variabilis]|uniref:HD domain-containing protein n=1 Tax=Microbulbifer variabilis TaxID=266805 RepID=UPI001CFC6179|nr:HD domain-containing protein [Microbulbifer variabilis]